MTKGYRNWKTKKIEEEKTEVLTKEDGVLAILICDEIEVSKKKKKNYKGEGRIRFQ